MLQLLDGQLFQFGHNVVQTFFVDETTCKSCAFVKQKVDVNVVENVSLQFLLQLLLLLQTQLLEITSLLDQFCRLVQSGRSRHIIYDGRVLGGGTQKINHFQMVDSLI